MLLYRRFFFLVVEKYAIIKIQKNKIKIEKNKKRKSLKKYKKIKYI